MCENKYIRLANINSSVTLIEMFESVVEYSFNCLEAEDKTKGYQISLFIKEALCIAGPEQEQTDVKIEPRKWMVNIIIYLSAMPDHFFSWLSY